MNVMDVIMECSCVRMVDVLLVVKCVERCMYVEVIMLNVGMVHVGLLVSYVHKTRSCVLM